MVSIVSIRDGSVINTMAVFREMMKIMHYVRPGNVFQGNCTSEGYWRCKDGIYCIDKGWVCEGNNNCFHGSDEDYALCKDWKCVSGEYGARAKCGDK